MKKIWYVLLPIITLALLNFSCEEDDPMIDLPEEVHSYIRQNYGDYKIDESELDTLCSGDVVYEVEMERKGLHLREDEKTLIFGSEGGNFLFSEHEMKVNDLPAEVKQSISRNFAGYTAEEAERLDFADGIKQYEVELKNNSTIKEVLFAANGTVICEATESDDDDN